MNDAPLPRNRRRRNIVTITVVVFVSLVTWWYWPRGDARFVGKWRVTINGAPSPEVLKLSSKGLAKMSDGTTVVWTNWRVEGSEWISGIHTPRWITESLHDLALLSKGTIGQAYRNRELRWTIESADRDAIRLTYLGLSPELEMVLTRIPE